MANNFIDANADTPTPGPAWLLISDDERVAVVNGALAAMTPPPQAALAVVEAKQDGQVIVKLLDPIPAGQRGTVLLDLEVFLKDSIDPGLAVWLMPLGDRSSLRNLRGIEVAS